MTRSSPQRRRSAAGGPRPRKALGQHFLRDTGVLADIAAAVGPADTLVLEVGAGTGQLTEALLAAGHQVIAVEIEGRLVTHLQRRFAGAERLQVVQADAREIDLSSLVAEGRQFVVAGNLPYFAATYIVRRVLEAARQPSSLVVMVQREVAREYAAPPGKLSLLAIGIQMFAVPEILFDVAAESFDPPPAVWSAVVRLTVRPEPLLPRSEQPKFFDFVSRVFRNPRKQLHNALQLPHDITAAALAAAEIDGMRRPETLTIDEWRTLQAAVEQGLARG